MCQFNNNTKAVDYTPLSVFSFVAISFRFLFLVLLPFHICFCSASHWFINKQYSQCIGMELMMRYTHMYVYEAEDPLACPNSHTFRYSADINNNSERNSIFGSNEESERMTRSTKRPTPPSTVTQLNENYFKLIYTTFAVTWNTSQ